MFMPGGISPLIVILVFVAVVLITLISCFCLHCYKFKGKTIQNFLTGVRGLWKVIHNCLTCESCLPAIQATAEALEQVKEARSDTHSAKSQEPPSKPPHLYPSLKGIEGEQD